MCISITSNCKTTTTEGLFLDYTSMHDKYFQSKLHQSKKVNLYQKHFPLKNVNPPKHPIIIANAGKNSCSLNSFFCSSIIK